ncbi:hypothetical protein ABH926_000599 [Catenulispora sp. GP43]|uniref:hypothetical protein n=1 Tax=Catenulispora sp. GP43 TaxID=3156263 RepID=UPI00351150F1
MSAPTDVPAAPPTPGSAGGAPSRLPAGPVRVLALALAAGWLIPMATHAAGLDIVLVPLIVAATAAQLTIGSTLSDRLIPAVGLVCGTAIAGGFVFSSWPWGLQPVPVAGVWFSALSLLAFRTHARTGRRPSLPRRVVGSDLPLLAAGGYGAWVALAPVLRTTPTAGLGYTTLTGDRMRQFGLFDTISRVGGYPFLHWRAAASVVDPKIGRNYPAGMHYLYALLDSFVTSGTRTSPVAELDRYRDYVALGFAFLVLSVAWGARRVLGPATPGWQRALVVSAAGAWAATGVLTTMLWCTWDAEVLALGFMALAAAIAVRPISRPTEQLLLVGALVAAAGFTYTLYVPFAWALAAVFGFANRRRLRPHLWFTAAVGTVSLLISVTPYLLQLRYDTVSTSDGLLTPGFAITVPHSTLLVLAGLCALGLLSATGRRRPTTATLALLLGTAIAVVAAFGLYQLAKIGFTTYYFPKAMHVALVFAVMGAGTAVTVLKPGWSGGTAALWKRRAAGTAGALAGVIAVGAASPGPVRFQYQDMYPGPDTTWARVWDDGRQIFGVHGAALAYLSDRHLLGDGRPTVALWDRTGSQNRDLTLIMAALNHDSGTMGPILYGLTDLDGLAGVAPPPRPGAPLAPGTESALGAFTDLVRTSRVPLRVITPDPVVAARLRAIAASHPSLKLAVLYLPDLPGERSPA